MHDLNLPKYGIKIRKDGDRQMIFDDLRRKYVALTPEEWVRQHFVHYLIDHKGYPEGLLGNEIQLVVGAKKLRCDSVLYDRSLHPRMIMEYKAPNVNITQKTFDQIMTYNMLLHVDYLVVSNGLSHYCCHIDYDNQKYLFLKDIPDYENILLNGDNGR
ncbi:MAG: type I restriction enzyme HsdR N-terminal domain-containing protein [Prevotella sp.]|nr:type I restriction enzyme HsdR N-terminal domain-containing protein [Prevotella sp.]